MTRKNREKRGAVGKRKKTGVQPRRRGAGRRGGGGVVVAEAFALRVVGLPASGRGCRGEQGFAKLRMPKQTHARRGLARGLWAPENQAFVREAMLLSLPPLGSGLQNSRGLSRECLASCPVQPFPFGDSAVHYKLFQANPLLVGMCRNGGPGGVGGVLGA